MKENQLPYLWKIREGYLAGSIHCSDESYESHLNELVGDVETLALEMDISEAFIGMLRPDNLIRFMGKESLDDYLTESEIRGLGEKVPSAPLIARLLDPSHAALVITEKSQNSWAMKK